MAPHRLRTFLEELRRRKVIRVAIGYTVGAWAVVQGAGNLLQMIEAPEWIGRAVVLLVALGFPLALVVSWLYDATLAGFVRTHGATSLTAGEWKGPLAQGAALHPSVGALPAPGAALPHLAPAAGGAGVSGARPAPARSVAVLPFIDLSPERNQEHFSDGIAEEVLNALVGLEDLRVAARTSSFAFKRRTADVRTIGSELGVAAVVEGSVRMAGNRVRVTAQLIDVADGYHLWSERYDRELDDVFAIQDEIAGNIAAALEVKLARPHHFPTVNVRAYDLYLRGRHLFHQIRRQSMEEARACFLAAADLDPGFARAYGGAAMCSGMLYMYWDEGAENLERADRDSLRALELAPEEAESHTARGLALSVAKRYDEAQAEFEAALRIDASSFEAYYFYARSSWSAGRLEQAGRLFEAAAELRPEDYESIALAESVYAALGRTEDESHAAHRALSRIERHLALYPSDVRALYLGAGNLVRLGQPERAREWLDRALALEPEDCAIQYNAACVYARMGDTDQAIERLKLALERGFAHREWIDHDGDFARIRDDPRFGALLATLT